MRILDAMLMTHFSDNYIHPMKSQDIRTQFLKFFEERQHLIVPSAPIVLKDDPTLMFNNSGMAQFKEYFLGNATPKRNRIADTQKCLRVSGKHNDLEDVGFDTYHHTMFEMLGNWSFGDYFKKEAINWAWELLTEVYKIPKDILYVTVLKEVKKRMCLLTKRLMMSGRHLSLKIEFCWGTKKTIFGRWATKDHAGLVQKST